MVILKTGSVFHAKLSGSATLDKCPVDKVRPPPKEKGDKGKIGNYNIFVPFFIALFRDYLQLWATWECSL